MEKTDIKIDHWKTVNLTGILCLEFGTLGIITFWLWIWKVIGILQ
jgi:hypothetical protein